VQAHGGIIEAFQGDAILAVWYGEQVHTDALDSLEAPDTLGVVGASAGSAASASHQRAQTRSQAQTATPAHLTSETHHAQRALHAAVKLLAAMHGVLPDPAPAGLEPLSLGIGVESGPAMAGSLGLASRRTHMVMGRTVTIASRLVTMTSDLAHPILVGEGLAAQTGAASLQSMGTFMLDGLRVPHHVYAYPVFPAPRL
jgi:adenylate cyclase